VDKESTFGLSASQLAEMLAIGSDGNGTGEGTVERRTRSEEMQRMLGLKVNAAGLGGDSITAVLGRPCDELAGIQGTLEDLLLADTTGLPVLKVLKDYAKAVARRGRVGARHAAATAIYYAAIANALVHDDRKISGHSYEKLREGFETLRRKTWIPCELKKLFGLALEIGRHKRESS